MGADGQGGAPRPCHGLSSWQRAPAREASRWLGEGQPHGTEVCQGAAALPRAAGPTPPQPSSRAVSSLPCAAPGAAGGCPLPWGWGGSTCPRLSSPPGAARSLQSPSQLSSAVAVWRHGRWPPPAQHRGRGSAGRLRARQCPGQELFRGPRGQGEPLSRGSGGAAGQGAPLLGGSFTSSPASLADPAPPQHLDPHPGTAAVPAPPATAAKTRRSPSPPSEAGARLWAEPGLPPTPQAEPGCGTKVLVPRRVLRRRGLEGARVSRQRCMLVYKPSPARSASASVRFPPEHLPPFHRGEDSVLLW